jgi:integrase/recombinase XerD
MPPARTSPRRRGPVPGYQATTSTRPGGDARDALPGHPLARHIDDFLTDLANANKPRNTIRAYRGDLIGFAAHHDGEIAALTAAPVRAFLGEVAGQAASTRKRKRAAVASFCKWAVRHDLLDASPMDRIDAIEVPRTLPRPAAAADVAAVLEAICSRRPRTDVPVDVLRDRVLFETAYVCGARASEVCGMYVEDLDLRPDDEHARVHGKGGTVRTVLLDDRSHIALLKLYLARSGYTSGPLFRASINGRGGPLSYDAAHNRWKKYCAAAGAGIGIHQLRHAHATELKVSGVASAASFGTSREHALPAAQRAASRCPGLSGAPRGHDDLGLHGPPGSDATMMRLIPLHGVHHRCACWHRDAAGSSRLHRVHHRRSR